MIDLRIDFFEKLKTFFPKAQEAYDEATKNQLEGETILWIIVYMFIGGKIGEEYIQIPKENLKSLFDLIESGASSEDEDLSTAVLTGLLETMTDPLMKDREIWKQAQGILGENSLRHMLAMNKFYGIE